MHHFYYFAIFPVTALTVAGYVTLYCARNADGRMRTAGRLLSAWCFLLAIGVVILALIHPSMEGRGPGQFGHMGGAMHGEGAGGPMMPNAPLDQPAPPPSETPPATDGTSNSSTGWKTN